MIFTGKNLVMVGNALLGVIADLNNDIATCPDADEYTAELERIEQKKRTYARLYARVEKAIAKEQSK